MTMNMSTEAIQSLIRNVMQFAGGFVIGSGYLSASQWEMAIGIAVSLAAFAASLFNKKKLLAAPAVV